MIVYPPHEHPLAQEHLDEARKLVDFLHAYQTNYPTYYAAMH
jgi:hypothetical protein